MGNGTLILRKSDISKETKSPKLRSTVIKRVTILRTFSYYSYLEDHTNISHATFYQVQGMLPTNIKPVHETVFKEKYERA